MMFSGTLNEWMHAVHVERVNACEYELMTILWISECMQYVEWVICGTLNERMHVNMS